MLTGRCLHRCFVLTAILAIAAETDRAWSQSNASLATDPGSTITLTVGFSAATDLGTISETDTDTTTVDGTARVTLVPDPPFSHCRMQALSMELGDIQLSYYFNTIHATFTNLTIETAGPFGGRVSGASTIFPVTDLRITGFVYLYSAIFSLDDTLPVEATTSASMATGFTEQDGTVVFDQFEFPRVEWVIPPELLPGGFSALEVTVDADGSGLSFRGPLTPAILGDGDADEDVDLHDFSEFLLCYFGPDVPQVPLCSLFMFDDDPDVDLDDYVEFHERLLGPQ